MTTDTTPAPVPVGTIYSSMWGYDQTNVDYFEVIASTPKTVQLRPIRQRVIDAAGYMSEHVEPLPGDYIGDAIRRKVHADMGNGVSINSYANAYPWEGTRDLQTHYA